MVEHKESSIEKFEKFTWKIENFSHLNGKVYYEHFVLGGYPWRINLHPKGDDKPGHLSIYLEAVTTGHMSEGWSRNAKFKLIVFNQLDTNLSLIEESKNEFNAINCGWGYSSFMPLMEVHDLKKGFIVNDACIVGVEVFVSSSIHEKQLSHEINNKFESLTSYVEVEDSVLNVKDPEVEFVSNALGKVFYFLETRKVRDMNEQAYKELQALWGDLVKFKSGLTRLEAHVQSALGMKSFVEKALSLENLKEKIIILELETVRLKEKLVTAWLSMDIERELLKAKGVIEIDLDSVLGRGS